MRIKSKAELNVFVKPEAKRPVFRYRFRVKPEGAPRAREIYRSSGVSDEREAREIAWQDYLREMGLSGDGSKRRVLRDDSPTVGRVCEVYVAEIADFGRIMQKYARQNAEAFERFCGLVWPGRKVEGIKVSELDEAAVTAWRKAFYAARGADFGTQDLALNISLNSTFTKVRSVFSADAMRLYEKRGLVLPESIEEFRGVRRLRQDPEAMRFQRIPDAVDERMQREVWELGDPRLGVAFELARFCGLREDELLGARWHWIEEGRDGAQLAVIYRSERKDPAGESFTPKNKKGRRVGVNPDRLARWREAYREAKARLAGQRRRRGNLPEVSESFDFLIPGRTKTEREKLVGRELSQWVAGFLPDREKTLHELRKQAGSDIAALDGVAAAATFLGDTLEVAMRHYVDGKQGKRAL